MTLKIGVDVVHFVEKSELHTSFPLQVGQSIVLTGESNRYRFRVVDVGHCIATIEKHRRPSRGYAKHLRKMKVAK